MIQSPLTGSFLKAQTPSLCDPVEDIIMKPPHDPLEDIIIQRNFFMG
jgi:hypothetical protein